MLSFGIRYQNCFLDSTRSSGYIKDFTKMVLYCFSVHCDFLTFFLFYSRDVLMQFLPVPLEVFSKVMVKAFWWFICSFHDNDSISIFL